MALQIAWLLDKLGNKQYAWSQTKAVMDFDRGGGLGQTLEKTLNDGLIQEYTCTTDGTTHALTGTGNNIKFVADSTFNEGDTITVNGSSVIAKTQGGQPLQDGIWSTGSSVVCYLNGQSLTFGSSGNTYQPPVYSTTDWIPTGETWIDGKPIYMKVYSGPISANSAVPGLDGIESIVAYGGCAKRSDVQEWFTVPYAAVYTDTYSHSNFTLAFLLNTSGELELRCFKGGTEYALADSNIWIKATRL